MNAELILIPTVSWGLLSEQWNAGARWLWFMPWYDNDGAALSHADKEWWQDAMSQSYVITAINFLHLNKNLSHN